MIVPLGPCFDDDKQPNPTVYECNKCGWRCSTVKECVEHDKTHPKEPRGFR